MAGMTVACRWDDPAMTSRLLVLGGTAWLGRLVAERGRDRGFEVTCLARGSAGSVPEGVRLVTADRSQPEAYSAVADAEWDAVVEVSWQPGFVEDALTALGERADRWVYVSSTAVYLHEDVRWQDENAPRHRPLESRTAQMTREDYCGAKVRCEDLVRSARGARHLMARPGIFCGPGDPTERLGYWVSRLALAGDGPVLVPDAPDQPIQVLDVRDLAEWITGTLDSAVTGPVNLVGTPVRFADMIQLAAEVAGFSGDLVPARADWLLDHGVRPWGGPGSLPLWLLPGHEGAESFADAHAVALGLRRRSLRESLVDTLEDERVRGLDRPRAAGLGRVEELALIGELS
jgi:nucleoside-diphosphate-sugar epimerase